MVLDLLVGLGAGVLLGLSIAVPPGPMNALIANHTVTRSRLSGQFTGFGAMTADGVFLGITLAVGTALAPDRGFRIFLFVLGALVMFYLGWRTYGAYRAGLQIQHTQTAADTARAYVTGLTVGLSNPFQILWWLTAGLAFMTEIGPSVAAGFFLGILLWTTSFPYFLDRANRRYRGTYRIVLLLSLVLLLAFGALLVALAALAAAG